MTLMPRMKRAENARAGLRHLHGVIETREALKDVMEIQIVAFPQSGVLRRHGTSELLNEALQDGADVLGALDPSLIEQDPVASLDFTFATADHHAKPIDIHLHEPGEIGAFTFGLLLDRARPRCVVIEDRKAGSVGAHHGAALGGGATMARLEGCGRHAVCRRRWNT